MKRTFIFSLLLLFLLTACSVGVAAEGDPTIVLTDATGMPGETVSVTIRMDHNPGIIGARIRVGYDNDALELIKCDLGDFPASGYTTGPITNQPFTVLFCEGTAPKNYTFATFAILHFRIKEDAAPDTYPLTMTCDFSGDFFNVDMEEVYFNLDQGRITVVPSTKPAPSTTGASSAAPSATEAGPTVTNGVTNTDGTATTATAVTAATGTGSGENAVTTPSRNDGQTTQTTAAIQGLQHKLSQLGFAGKMVPVIAVVVLISFFAILAICNKKR